MIAEQVRDTDLADYQRAVRTLLVHPLLTETHPWTGALALVRRFADTLGADLAAVAGYRLELDAHCARLVRRLDRLDDTQQVRRKDKKPFDQRRYAYLCLVLAALGRAGSQVALTELADALRRRAAEIDGLGFDPDSYHHRRAFVDVVRHLLQTSALSEVEASAVAWVRDPEAGEALYDVDRDVVHFLFVPPRVIQHVTSVEALLTEPVAASRDTRRAETRQRLARLLLEHPVLEVGDLDDAERAYLTSQATSLAAELERLTGGQIERRAEGLALVDATGGFSDRRFPTAGTPAQVALLLADAMAAAVERDRSNETVERDRSNETVERDHSDNVEVIGAAATATVPRVTERTVALVARLDRARPNLVAAADELRDDAGAPSSAASDHTPPTATPADLDRTEVAAPRAAEVEGPGPVEQGPLFTDAWLRERTGELIATHGRTFAADLRDAPDALARAAVEVLTSFDLVREVDGGVVARPAIARYRGVRVEVRRQPSLLDAEHEAPA